MCDNQIFDEEEPSFELKEVRPTHYIDINHDDQFISQFLSIDDVLVELSNQPEEFAIEEVLEEIKEASEIEEINVPLKTKTKKKRSTFHNFQKHLVTTIRLLVDPSHFGRCPETQKCELALWKVFMNSVKINKTLVTLILGGLSFSEITNLKEYHFQQILSQFSELEIKEAQMNMAEEVLSQLRESNLKQELKYRRMKFKEEFIVYFNAFLEELTNGELDKRMTKCTKLLRDKKE